MAQRRTTSDSGTLGETVRREVERAIQRTIKGFEYAASPAPEMGATSKDVVYRRGTLVVYHYRARTDEVYRVPVMLVMSLVSKSYILDLAPGHSFVEFLVERGFDVYLVDWGVPRPDDSHLRLEDYALDFIPDCIARVLADSGEDELSIVGYCMGGMLAVMYAALHPEGPLRSLACFTTPIDYDGMGLFKVWTDPRYFDADRITDAMGNVPPEVILQGFNLLRPLSKMTDPLRLWDNMWNDDYVDLFRRIDRWSNDQIPFPGECFRQTTKELMQQNLLYKGEFRLGGRLVDLSRIRVPFLHVLAEHDHIVPYDSAKALVGAVGSADKEEVVLKGGHVSLVAGRNAARRLWPKIDAWLSVRST